MKIGGGEIGGDGFFFFLATLLSFGQMKKNIKLLTLNAHILDICYSFFHTFHSVDGGARWQKIYVLFISLTLRLAPCAFAFKTLLQF